MPTATAPQSAEDGGLIGRACAGDWGARAGRGALWFDPPRSSPGRWRPLVEWSSPRL